MSRRALLRIGAVGLTLAVGALLTLLARNPSPAATAAATANAAALRAVDGCPTCGSVTGINGDSCAWEDDCLADCSGRYTCAEQCDALDPPCDCEGATGVQLGDYPNAMEIWAWVGGEWATISNCAVEPAGSDIIVCVGSVVALCGFATDHDDCVETGEPNCGMIYHDPVSTSLSLSEGAPVCELDDGYGCVLTHRPLAPGEYTVTLLADDAGCSGADDGTASCPLNIKAVCCGPNEIEVGTLCPDGEDTTIAKTWHVREVEWSIVGADLGCTLEQCPDDGLECWNPASDCLGVDPPVEQSVRIVAGTQSGTITLQVKDKIYQDCVHEQEVAIGCGSCSSGDCSPGEGSASVGRSLDVRFGLGKASDGRTAGELVVHLDRGTDALPTVREVAVRGKHAETAITRSSHDLTPSLITPIPTVSVVSAVSAPEASVEVVYDTGDVNRAWYAILFREAGVTSGTPHTSWKMSGDSDSLLVAKYVDGVPPGVSGSAGTIERAYRCEYSVDPNNANENWTWTIETAATTTGTAERTESETWEKIGSTTWKRTYTLAQDGGTVSDVAETWEEYSFGKAVTERKVSTGGGSLKTEKGYYTSGNGVGSAKYIIEPDGSWTWYEYNSSGRVSKVWTPWKDVALSNPPTAPTASNVRELAYSYDATTGRISSVVETVLGIAASRTDFEYSSSSGPPETWTTIEKRCVNPTGTCTYMTTTRVYEDEEREKLLSVDFPDGRRDEYTRTMGDYYDGGGDPESVAFDPNGPQDFELEIVEHKLPSGGSPAAVAGLSTKSHTVRNSAGRVVWVRECAYDGSAYDTTTPISWTVNYYDDRGRLEDTYRSNHAHTEYGNDCCGLAYSIDPTGTRIDYERDLLSRVTSQTKDGWGTGSGVHPDQPDLVTEYDYSADGPLVTSTTVRDGGSTLSLTTYSARDLAGRAVSETDAAGLETTYAYTDGAGGGRIVTVTRPDGSTEISEYYRDGRVKSVSGTGVVKQTYDYGVNSDGSTWTKTYIGPDGTSSDRWTKTTTDSLGRTVSDERPAYGSGTPLTTVYTYESSGGRRLISTQLKHGTTALEAARVLEYNAASQVERSGLDINADGDLDNASDDRITESPTRLVKIGSDWWRETTQKTYRTASSATVTTLGKSREQLSGLPANTLSVTQAEDFHENVTTTSTTVSRANKLVTQTTDYPATDNDATTVTRNGLVQTVTDVAQLTTSLGYDALGRRTTVTDARGVEQETVYDPNTGLVTSTVLDGNATNYVYFGAAGAHPGHLKSIENALGNFTYFDYNARGETTRTWGDAVQPTAVHYDEFGQRDKLSTFRDTSVTWTSATWPSGVDPNDPADADITEWAYDDATGLMTQKTYADSSHVDYAYSVDGKLNTRNWAREYASSNPLTTTYGYSAGSSGTGELLTIDYEDSTPDVSMTYNRSGLLASATDALGERTFVYDPGGPRTREKFETGSWFAGRRITLGVVDYVPVEVDPGPPAVVEQVPFARLSALSVGTSTNATADYSASYDYDGDTGRMSSVTGTGLPAGGVAYGYLADSHLLATTEFKDGSGTIATLTRAFESGRDLLASVESKWGSTVVSKYAYVNDDVGRRTSCVRTGNAFSADHHDVWAYNDRNELTGTTRRAGTTVGSGTVDTALGRGYAYDPIGNRTSYTEGASAALYYCANELNQYTTADDDDANCPPGSPDESFTYDADGNLTQDGAFDYSWDAENRLIAVVPRSPVNGSKKVEYKYDYMGRRVERKVFTYASGWPGSPSEHRRYVWYNWLLIMETDALQTGFKPTRKFTWGLDLAGQSGGPVSDRSSGLESAGGIGGLLATYDTNGGTTTTADDRTFIHFYDGNGNTGQLVETTSGGNNGTTQAKYEYDAYGNSVASSGGYAATNPWRFSTKWFESETGLLYYGYRYYSPRLGRWFGRDPIGEADSSNRYSFVHNCPSGLVDSDGRQSRPCPFMPPGATCDDIRRMGNAPIRGGQGPSATPSCGFLNTLESWARAAAPTKEGMCVERSFDLDKMLSWGLGESRNGKWYVTQPVQKLIGYANRFSAKAKVQVCKEQCCVVVKGAAQAGISPIKGPGYAVTAFIEAGGSVKFCPRDPPSGDFYACLGAKVEAEWDVWVASVKGDFSVKGCASSSKGVYAVAQASGSAKTGTWLYTSSIQFNEQWCMYGDCGDPITE